MNAEAVPKKEGDMKLNDSVEYTRNDRRLCDFDKNPTSLYLYIQQKNWNEVERIAFANPASCSIWVSRKETDGTLRWCLLPLHAAIIFKAPSRTIMVLLKSYPLGATCKDDQGMLPIHLAFRNQSEMFIVYLLIIYFPESLQMKDRKNRSPRAVVESLQNNPLMEGYLEAIENAPHYINLISNKFTAKIKDLEIMHKEAMEAGKVLMEHSSSLEAQLTAKSETERFLANKIANLDSELKESIQTNAITEARNESEKHVLEAGNSNTRNICSTMEAECESLRAMVTKLSTKLKEKEKQEKSEQNPEDSAFDLPNLRNVGRLKKMQIEKSEAIANAAVLEMQLKRKTEAEIHLVTQVSDLAGKLAEFGAESNSSADSYLFKISNLEKKNENQSLMIDALTEKLSDVAVTLDVMGREQGKIVEFASRHEETMSVAVEAQQKILADTARQEQIILDATKERETIVDILTRQAEDIEKTSWEREKILDAVKLQESNMAKANRERVELVCCVSKSKFSMDGLKADIKNVCEMVDEDDYNFDRQDRTFSISKTGMDDEETEEVECINTKDDTCNIGILRDSDDEENREDTAPTIREGLIAVKDDDDWDQGLTEVKKDNDWDQGLTAVKEDDNWDQGLTAVKDDDDWDQKNEVDTSVSAVDEDENYIRLTYTQSLDEKSCGSENDKEQDEEEAGDPEDSEDNNDDHIDEYENTRQEEETVEEIRDEEGESDNAADLEEVIENNEELNVQYDTDNEVDQVGANGWDDYVPSSVDDKDVRSSVDDKDYERSLIDDKYQNLDNDDKEDKVGEDQ